MNEDTVAFHSLSQVRSRQDAFDWWLTHREVTRGTTLVVSHPDASSLEMPVRRSFGRTHYLLSVFSSPYLTVLNDRIVAETARRGNATIAVDSNIGFDTNEASYLQGLFAGQETMPLADLKAFLQAFGGNRLNWDFRSYLHENAEALLTHTRDRHIYETILASEKLSALDVQEFLATGRLDTSVPLEELRTRACAEIAGFIDQLESGGSAMIDHHRKPLYAALLYMTLLHREDPSPRRATAKLKNLIRFMDRELASLFLLILWAAWRWFRNDSQTSIFNELQPGAKAVCRRAANISWDLYHMTQQPALIMTSRKGADVLLPYFLTADRRLADFWASYPVRSCWAHNGLGHPLTVPALDIVHAFKPIVADDMSFAHRFLSTDAHESRRERLRTAGPPIMEPLIKRLEDRL